MSVVAVRVSTPTTTVTRALATGRFNGSTTVPTTLPLFKCNWIVPTSVMPPATGATAPEAPS